MSFGWYLVEVCLLFLPVMYLGVIHLLFGWYSIDCIVLFTCLLSVGSRHVDFLTLPGNCISCIYNWSYCYPMVRASIPVACQVHPGDIGVWWCRSSLSIGIYEMVIRIKIFIQQEQCDGKLSIHLAGIRGWRFGIESLTSGKKVMEIWVKVFVQQEQYYRYVDQSVHPVLTKLLRAELMSLSSGNSVMEIRISVIVS